MSFGAAAALVELVEVEQGQNATLRCSYKTQTYGHLNSCWSKGELPSRGMCGSNTIISSDGLRVTHRASHRYVLGGHLSKGDVSLTILNVSAQDTGTYGCRVDFPGWNNDQKHHFLLIVRQAADPTTAAPLNTTSSSALVTSDLHFTSSDLVSSSTDVWTSSSVSRTEEKNSSTVLLMCLFILLFLLTLIIIVIIVIMKKRRLFQKMSENLNSVQFNSTNSTVHLEQRSQSEREENIYS
ncbi:hypothetical protein WMY93_007941 [Mugilogobius chulae]|uniref:Ig-like domain-containing protein n=1 Tax=Mugilogobius chulae TaxID=88201 RepID=A0AAW0PEG7_9GOBI